MSAFYNFPESGCQTPDGTVGGEQKCDAVFERKGDRFAMQQVGHKLPSFDGVADEVLHDDKLHHFGITSFKL